MKRTQITSQTLTREIQRELTDAGIAVPYMVILHRVRTTLEAYASPVDGGELKRALYTHFAEGKP